MPKTRSGMDSSVAPPESDSDNGSDETIVDRVDEMERRIVEENERHKRELELREQLFRLRLEHQREMEALARRYDDSIRAKRSDSPAYDGKHEENMPTKRQIAARKAICTSLPKFGGEPEKWPLFYSSFNATTEACGFSNQENMKRLMDSLEGEALEAVKGRLILPESVPEVIQDLKNLFGRPGRLLKALLQQIRDAPKPEEDKLETFIGFGVKVRQLKDHIVASELGDHLSNPMLVEELVEKLPHSYRREWVRFRRGKSEPILSVFANYIQTVSEEAAEVAEFLDTSPRRSQPTKVSENCEQKHKRPMVRDNGVETTRLDQRDKGIETTRLDQRDKRVENAGVDRRNKGNAGSERAKAKQCFGCGNYGHISKECLTPRRGMKCFKCGELGHISSRCQSENQQPARTNVIRSRAPTVSVDFDGRVEYAMVDTGSDVSMMRQDFFDGLSGETREKLKRSSQVIRGYGGQDFPVHGELTCKVKIGNKTQAVKFLVAAKSAIDAKVLIGIDTLEKLNYSIINGRVEIMEDDSTENEECVWVHRVICDDPEELNVPPRYRNEVETMVQSYNPQECVGSLNKMKIELSDETPIGTVPRRLAPLEKDVVKRQVCEWLDNGIIRPSRSQFASPIVVVPKKDGSRRVCVDYREINKRIVRDSYPMPNIEDQIDELADARVFTTMDLKNSYFHVEVEENSRPYTAFVTHDGQYEFMRAPFGLCISGSAFGRFISSVFREMIDAGIMMAFVDDIIIPSRNEEEGLEYLRRVLAVAEKAGLIFNWKKCVFLQRRVEYLGYVIAEGYVRPASQKVEKLKNFPSPRTTTQLQRFYGLANYFRKFIPGFSCIMKPLSELLKKDCNFRFGEEQAQAFERIKDLLTTKPVLMIFKPGRKTEVHTDASKEALAGILMQYDEDGKNPHPCYYYSRLTNAAEKNYHSFELESLAVVESLRKFRCYLLGNKFKVITDCVAFKQALEKKIINPRTARWLVSLAEFEYDVEHRSADRMRHVDALSRPSVRRIVNYVGDKIRNAQENDEEICSIIKEIEGGKQISDFTIEKGILYKGHAPKRWCVPKSMQDEMIRQAHEQGHFGVKKTKERLVSECHIADVEEKIRVCISNCVRCIVSEKKRGKAEGQLQPIPKGEVPLDTFHVDHLGPMPSTRKAYSYIFTVVDAFTKFIWLFPIKTTGAAEVVKKLGLIAETFGDPRRIICDRGAAFTSGLFDEYCAERDIEVHRIVTGVPRGNGQVERVHRTIVPVLTKLSAEKPEEWFRYVSEVQTVINNSWQRAIRMTPFELLVGTKMRTKNNVNIYELLQEEMHSSFLEDRSELRKMARGNIEKIQQENRHSYDLRRKPTTNYGIGDTIAIPVTQFSVGGKVKPKYYGPYRIVKILPNKRCEVMKINSEAQGPRITTTAMDVVKSWPLLGQK